MAFAFGARGPHVVDCPAAGAFDGEEKRLPSGQQTITVSASDILHDR